MTWWVIVLCEVNFGGVYHSTCHFFLYELCLRETTATKNNLKEQKKKKKSHVGKNEGKN